MAVLLIRHQVQSDVAWKAVFDEHATMRRTYGSRSERAFRGHADPEEVQLYLEWDDSERARLFVRSDDLREAMVRAGVADRPDVWILKEVDRPSF